MHEHSCYFTDAPGRWVATCACGLAVEMTAPSPDRSTWRWTLHGELPPVGMMLGGIGSVIRARREMLVGLTPGGN